MTALLSLYALSNIVVAKGENMSAPTILIIDDDPDFVMVTKAILETKQYKVQCPSRRDLGSLAKVNILNSCLLMNT